VPDDGSFNMKVSKYKSISNMKILTNIMHVANILMFIKLMYWMCLMTVLLIWKFKNICLLATWKFSLIQCMSLIYSCLLNLCIQCAWWRFWWTVTHSVLSCSIKVLRLTVYHVSISVIVNTTWWIKIKFTNLVLFLSKIIAKTTANNYCVSYDKLLTTQHSWP
jgi:hypothetical protein